MNVTDWQADAARRDKVVAGVRKELGKLAVRYNLLDKELATALILVAADILMPKAPKP